MTTTDPGPAAEEGPSVISAAAAPDFRDEQVCIHAETAYRDTLQTVRSLVALPTWDAYAKATLVTPPGLGGDTPKPGWAHGVRVALLQLIHAAHGWCNRGYDIARHRPGVTLTPAESDLLRRAAETGRGSASRFVHSQLHRITRRGLEPAAFRATVAGVGNYLDQYASTGPDDRTIAVDLLLALLPAEPQPPWINPAEAAALTSADLFAHLDPQQCATTAKYTAHWWASHLVRPGVTANPDADSRDPVTRGLITSEQVLIFAATADAELVTHLAQHMSWQLDAEYELGFSATAADLSLLAQDCFPAMTSTRTTLDRVEVQRGSFSWSTLWTRTT